MTRMNQSTKKDRIKKLGELFFSFAKIGLLAFGGGYAMVPMIEELCVVKKKWITEDDMLGILAVAESTPGPIAINCATFVGSRQCGFAGALSATFGVVLPSFLIVFLISLFFDRFLELRVIADAFRGIRIAVGLLIFDAGFRMAKRTPKKKLPRLILAVSFLAMLLTNLFAWNFSSISLMLAAGAVSLAVYSLEGIKKGGEGN